MKKSFNFNNLFCLTVFLMLFSCQQNLEDPQFTGKVEFTFNASKNFEGKAAKNNIEDARYVLVKIAKDDGEIVYENEKLELYKFGDDFVSAPLALNPGNYQLLEFMVLDENNQVIYATPLEGSELAPLVTNPLPMDFEVAQDVTLKLVPEVVDVDGTTAEAFGYTTFSFDPILAWDFQLSVFAYDQSTENFELTEADLYVVNGEDTTQTETLEPATNYITLAQDLESYTIIISKEGKQSYVKEFTTEDLRAYLNTPLIVVLEEGNIISLQPGSELGKDALVGSLAPDANHGDVGHFQPYAWTINGALNVVRNFIDFDILNHVQNAEEIDKVYLHLFYNERPPIDPFGQGHHGENSFNVYRITSPWEEMGVTWNTQPSVDESVSVLVPKSTTKTEDYKIDVTVLVKEMVNNPESSYGFALQLIDETPFRTAVFASSDHPNSDLWPKLEIIKK